MFILPTMQARVLRSTTLRRTKTTTKTRRRTTMRLGCLSLVMHHFLHSSTNRYLKQPFAIYVTIT